LNTIKALWQGQNNQTIIPDKDDKVSQTRKREIKKGYFCSELIAEAYVRMGLLAQSIEPSSFWPSTFGRENLKLLNGAKLLKLIKI